GRVTGSEDLLQSSNHGVTTVVVGNCGVGFAPCRPADRQALVNVMEGVEDIPEAVMAEGLPWNWETFPQYLDALDARHWDIDVAAYLPHSPLRVYVMGQRGLDREPATAEDIARMQALAEEAMAAGAVGFSTSRTMVHRRGDGEFIPSFHAATEELVAIASAVGGTGRGVVQMIPNLDTEDYDLDVDLLKRLAKGSGRPVTYSLAQWLADSTGWRKTLDAMGRFNAEEGTRLVAQVFPRPMGVIGGLETSVNPFSLCPSYQPIADLDLDLLKRLAKGSGRPVTYSLAQWLADSTGWRKTLDAMGRFNAEEGTRLVAQVFPRPMGVIGGLETSVNPFSLRPSYQPIADLP